MPGNSPVFYQIAQECTRVNYFRLQSHTFNSTLSTVPSVTSRPCAAISSSNSCRQPRFHLTEHPTSHRGVDTVFILLGCLQFATHVVSVSSLGQHTPCLV